MNIIENNKTFEDKKIRTEWDADKERWYFSVVDIVAALTDNDYQGGRKYWSVLKVRLKEEGSQLATNCSQLKMQSTDGKYYNTDVMHTEQILRLIQSIPSKKVEPLKLWLAQVGSDRIDETYDPELTISRALEIYKRKGYSDEWINQRLKTIDARKEFTDEIKRAGLNQNKDFSILTNILTEVWSGNSVKEYKNLKGLKKESLRDNMTNMELVLNMLAETTSTELSRKKNPKGFNETKSVVKDGANVAKVARIQAEKVLGESIINTRNAKQIRELQSKNDKK